jgi:hypothetical protein
MEPRRSVEALANGLRLVHRSLLGHLQEGLERLHGRVEGAGALLQLALHDPLFTWLAPMSRLIVELDELAETNAPDLGGARASVSQLIEEPGAFRENYLACLQDNPGVVMAHAALRSQLKPALR